MDVLLRNPNLAQDRLDFDLMSERSYRQTRDTISQENEVRTTSENGNDIRNEVNMRISQEMDGLISTVNSQIQRAVHEAISSQVLPQIQNTLRQTQNASGNVKTTRNEKPEQRSEGMIDRQPDGSTLLQRDNLPNYPGGECHYTQQ